MIILVITAATGIVTKGLWKNLEAKPAKLLIDALQKTHIPGTSHIIWKALQSEVRNLSGGDLHWFKRRSTRKKRPVTRDNTVAIINEQHTGKAQNQGIKKKSY